MFRGEGRERRRGRDRAREAWSVCEREGGWTWVGMLTEGGEEGADLYDPKERDHTDLHTLPASG